MTPVIVRYPLDPTGISPDNLVQGEVHQMVRRNVRAIATQYGAFFTASMKVVDTSTNQELVRGQQYQAVEMYELPTKRYGKEVCAIILITDTTVSDEVSLQYQAVGGEFSSSATAILQMIEALELDDRPLAWSSIVDLPSEFPPSHHLHDIGDTYGWEFVTHALERVRQAIVLGDTLSHDAIYRYIDAVNGQVSASVLAQIQQTANDAMAAHVAAADPHSQYLLKSDIALLTLAAVRKPVNQTPTAGQLNVNGNVTLTLGAYYSLYNLAQSGVQFQMSTHENVAGPLEFDITLNTAVSSYSYPTLLQGNTLYYWRARYKDSENVFSDWSTPTSFKTSGIGVDQPAVTAPVNGATVLTNGLTLTGSAFSVSGTTDTHQSSDWEIWTGPDGTGTRLFNSLNDTVNKTSISVPSGVIPNNSTVYPRVRYKATTLGLSSYSAVRSFTVNYPLFPTVIGEAYGGGYFAGNMTIAPDTFAVIVAPKATGQTQLALSNSTNDTGATSRTDSVGNTTKLVPGARAATYARALTIGGFTDWQVPAIDVLDFIFAALRPTLGSAPAIFKTGGSEAFTANYYWSSTQFNYIDSGYTADTPNYAYVDHVQGYSSQYLGWEDIVGLTPAVSCPAGQTLSNLHYSYAFQYDPSRGVADDQVYASYTCSYTTYEIVSYTPGEYYENTYYYSYAVSFGQTSANEASFNKTTSFNVRAVRLVKVS